VAGTKEGVLVVKRKSPSYSALIGAASLVLVVQLGCGVISPEDAPAKAVTACALEAPSLALDGVQTKMRSLDTQTKSATGSHVDTVLLVARVDWRGAPADVRVHARRTDGQAFGVAAAFEIGDPALSTTVLLDPCVATGPTASCPVGILGAQRGYLRLEPAADGPRVDICLDVGKDQPGDLDIPSRVTLHLAAAQSPPRLND